MEKTIQLPYDLTITFQATEGLVSEGSCGVMAITAATIKYEKGLSPQEKLSTVIHELLELAKAAFGLDIKHADIEILDRFMARTLLELGITLDLPEDDPKESVPDNTSSCTTQRQDVPFTLTA